MSTESAGQRLAGRDGPDGQPDPPISRTAPLGTALGAIVVAAALVTLWVARNPTPAWEHDVVDAVTRLPDAVGYPMRAVMQLGTLAAAGIVALAAGLLLRSWRAAAGLVAAGLVARLITDQMKDVVDRDRPAGVRLRGEMPHTFGYPSTHTAIAFALATVAVAWLPARWRWVPFALAAVVGLARMHVGVHNPLDVVGGALVGSAVGLAAAICLRA